jgi:hypothetical protein
MIDGDHAGESIDDPPGLQQGRCGHLQ